MITQTTKIDADVLAILVGNSVSWGTEANGQTSLQIHQTLDRALYVKVNKALEILGGKWDRKANAHLFKIDPRVQMEEVEAGILRETKWDFFETPDSVADRAVCLAEIKPNMRVLEPSAGEGALVRAILRAEPTAKVSCLEMNPERHAILTAQGCFMLTTPCDFLTVDVMFGRIVMNPPWSKGQDRAHLLHAWDCLAPGGILIAIVSYMTAYSPTKGISALYQSRDIAGVAAEPLVRGVFAGTDVRGAIVKLVRRS